MRRLIALALCAFSVASNALTPYELSIIQTNPAGTGFFQRFMAPLSPAPNTSGVLVYDGATTFPQIGYIGSGLSWNGATLSATAAAQVNSDWTASGSVAEILNKPSLATVATSGSYLDLSNRPAARSFNYPTRTLDTCYQPSATRDVQVSYNVTINTTSTLTAGGVGTVYLEAFTNSGCTTGTQEIGRFLNGNTQTLGLTVTMVQNVTGNLNGIVPAGMWVKQRTQINTGTGANVTFTALPGQETSL